MEPLPGHTFGWFDESIGRVLRSSHLGGVPHFFTTRGLALRGADGADWKDVARAIGVPPSHLARLKQVHGVASVVVAAKAVPAEGRWPHADIVMTDDPDVAVCVQVADCVPMLLADPAHRAVAAVHAGWRGTAAGIAREAVAAMSARFGSRPDRLVAAIGPSIGGCCYQVGPEVLEAFLAGGFSKAETDSWFRPDGNGDRLKLDVRAANRAQLVGAGLDPGNVAVCDLCTACHPSLFFSYRREGPGTGRLAGVIRPAGQAF